MQHDKVKFTTINQVKSRRQKSFTVDVLHIKVYKQKCKVFNAVHIYSYTTDKVKLNRINQNELRPK